MIHVILVLTNLLLTFKIQFNNSVQYNFLNVFINFLNIFIIAYVTYILFIVYDLI